MFNSWLAVLADGGRRLIAYLAPENEDLRHELFAANKAKAWFRTDFKNRDGSEYSAKAWNIIRVIFEIAVEKHPVPTVGVSTNRVICVRAGSFGTQTKKSNQVYSLVEYLQ